MYERLAEMDLMRGGAGDDDVEAGQLPPAFPSAIGWAVAGLGEGLNSTADALRIRGLTSGLPMGLVMGRVWGGLGLGEEPVAPAVVDDDDDDDDDAVEDPWTPSD